METALTPIEFARRARRLYADREAVVDGDLRFTYGQFLDRCDRWSSALQSLGVGQGDRVVYIAPNTHSHLESFYAVPQIGAVLVPVNYRLLPEDFEYIINHCGATVVCAHSDYIEAVDSIRKQLPGVEHFVALEGAGENWIDYETTLAAHATDFTEVEIDETDLITINYTSGTTARPKGVMITHRNAYMNVMGTLVHHHLTPADRYLWTLPMFHANGWTFPWINTARGMAHVCLRRVEPPLIFKLIKEENITMFCAAPTVLIGIANAPEEMRSGVQRGVRLFTAGAPPAAATIEQIERDLGWELTHVYGLTETTPLIAFCEARPEHQNLAVDELAKIKARQGVELVSSGELRVVDEDGNEVPHDGQTLGENISSVEVEGCLLRHPAVQEVAVVGMPHDKWGESPHAFVILRSGVEATEQELKLHVRESLAHFKTPQWVSFVEELPKTATGKVQKFVLRGGNAGISRQ